MRKKYIAQAKEGWIELTVLSHFSNNFSAARIKFIAAPFLEIFFSVLSMSLFLWVASAQVEEFSTSLPLVFKIWLAVLLVGSIINPLVLIVESFCELTFLVGGGELRLYKSLFSFYLKQEAFQLDDLRDISIKNSGVVDVFSTRVCLKRRDLAYKKITFRGQETQLCAVRLKPLKQREILEVLEVLGLHSYIEP